MREGSYDNAVVTPQGLYYRVWKLAEWLGSLKFTLAAMILFAAAVLFSYSLPISVSWAISPPLFILAVNLLAAVVTNPLFRKETGLLVFHLALISLAIFAGLSRLTYLRGNVEITEGLVFDPALADVDSGPRHNFKLDSVRFVNEGFKINYDEGPIRRDTYNHITWYDDNGASHSQIIGDDYPLVIKGYRFYTTANKGFAPIFTWYPETGSGSAGGSEPITGSVHFPSYPTYRKEQSKVWKGPGGMEIMTKLLFDEVIIDPKKPSGFRLPKDKRVLVQVRKKSMVLKQGDSIKLDDLPKGRLVYREMRTWMGYFIFYDWTTTWMLASCGVAVIGLALHYYGRFSRTSWLEAGRRCQGLPPKAPAAGVNALSAQADKRYKKRFKDGAGV